MPRSVLNAPAVLRAIAAAVTVVVLAAGPASARPDPSAGPGARPVPAACQAADLGISVPGAIAGDPAEGMGKRAWNIVFRNSSKTACSLRGWPEIVVHAAGGTTVATTVSDVNYSNLAAVPVTQVVLAAGQSAVVTAMSATAPAGCAARWTLGLTLPGGTRPVTVSEPAGSFAPCVGGQVRLSPFYAEQSLASDIRALGTSTAPPPFAAAAGAEPDTCATAALRAAVTSVADSPNGSIIELRLSNTGRACVLSEGWPTVKLQLAGGASQVAKIFPDTPAVQAGRKLLTTYTHGTTQSTALTLPRGAAVSVVLFAAATGPGTCQQVTSLVVYPTVAARGAGRTAPLATPARICGPPRVLSFVPSVPGDRALAIARGALAAAIARDAPATASPDKLQPNRPAGFYYGTDSAAPQACGNGHAAYTEPAGSCAKGTAGPYGEYIGEVGSFMNWQHCTTAGLAWDQANYNMATDNVVDFSTGLGAAAYWFAAGPGRDPHDNGTAAEAATWGQQQAQQALQALGGKVFDFRYVFLDIENNGVPPDEDGWNTVWNGPCGNHVKSSFIPPNVDFATWTGFANYIDNHSPYLAGVYSSGGNWYGSWAGIFSGGPRLSNTAEWTFTNEQADLTFPSGFTGSHASAQWFSSEPAACHLLLQWSGGNGVLNGYGDFDVAEAANDASPSCAPQVPSPVIIHHHLFSKRTLLRASPDS
jgi:Domain of unknown function (DUF4232)